MNKTNLQMVEVGWSFLMLGISIDFSKEHDYKKIMKIIAKHGKQFKKELKDL